MPPVAFIAPVADFKELNFELALQFEARHTHFELNNEKIGQVDCTYTYNFYKWQVI